VATTANPPTVWQRLTTALADELAGIKTAAAAAPVGSDTTGDAPHHARSGGPRDLTAGYAAIARTGTWPAGKYRSPSEARMAVITAAAWAGHTLTDVLGRLHSGAWPGLASLYARYAPGTRPPPSARTGPKPTSSSAPHPPKTAPRIMFSNPPLARQIHTGGTLGKINMTEEVTRSTAGSAPGGTRYSSPKPSATKPPAPDCPAASSYAPWAKQP